MRGQCAIRKIQRKRAIRHKHRTAFFVLQSTRGRSMSVRSTQSCERVKAASLGHPQSTRERSMRAHSTQSRNGCREGRRPFAGAGQRPAGVQRQSLWWGGEGQSPSVLPLPQNLFNRRFFLVCQRHMLLHRFHVLKNLRRAACAGNHRRNRRILQNPRKR